MANMLPCTKQYDGVIPFNQKSAKAKFIYNAKLPRMSTTFLVNIGWVGYPLTMHDLHKLIKSDDEYFAGSFDSALIQYICYSSNLSHNQRYAWVKQIQQNACPYFHGWLSQKQVQIFLTIWVSQQIDNK